MKNCKIWIYAKLIWIFCMFFIIVKHLNKEVLICRYSIYLSSLYSQIVFRYWSSFLFSFNSKTFFLYLITSAQWLGSQRGVQMEVPRDKYLCIHTLLEPNFFRFWSALIRYKCGCHFFTGIRQCASARSSKQRATSQSVRPPRACFQSDVIPKENVVRFSCEAKAHHRNSMCQSIVRCGQVIGTACDHPKCATTQSVLSNIYMNSVTTMHILVC